MLVRQAIFIDVWAIDRERAANCTLGSWRARSIHCRGQPFLNQRPNLHHCQMDSVRTTREETTLVESIQFLPRKFVIATALVVLVHTVVMLVHGAAHMRLNIGLSP